MLIQKKSIETGKTLLRSTSHIIVRTKKGNRLRSLLVGIQFGILHLPGELILVSLWPFVQNIVLATYYLVSNAWFVLRYSPLSRPKSHEIKIEAG